MKIAKALHDKGVDHPPTGCMPSEVAEAWVPKLKAGQAALKSLNTAELQAIWSDYLATCKRLRGND